MIDYPDASPLPPAAVVVPVKKFPVFIAFFDLFPESVNLTDADFWMKEYVMEYDEAIIFYKRRI